ncbi:MAG: polysaccharide pyruvyl transferase family protein [Candidatus Limnocylindria bacterium]
MTEPRPRRAAIVGFVGFGNLGDELILAGMERLLAPLPIRVTALFGGPELRETAAFSDARRFSPWRHLPTLSALRELRAVDVLIVGGGGLLNDHWPMPVPRYLAWVLAARVAGARVAWIGVGVGPIRRRPWRWLARLAARLSGPVLVRDHASAELLGGPSPRVVVMPDPVLFLDPPAGSSPEAALGLIVREPVHGRDADAATLVELIARFADAGRSAGFEPRLLLMAPEADRAFVGRVADRLAREGARPLVEALGPSAERAWDQLGKLDAVVSVRLHGLLLSAMAGIPCVPVAYDGKVAAAAERLGLADVVVQLRDETRADAVAWSLAAVREPDRKRSVAERVSALRDELDDVRRLLR